MPLEKGDNPEAIRHNIETEKAAGKSQEQSVAIALHTAKDGPEENKLMRDLAAMRLANGNIPGFPFAAGTGRADDCRLPQQVTIADMRARFGK